MHRFILFCLYVNIGVLAFSGAPFLKIAAASLGWALLLFVFPPRDVNNMRGFVSLCFLANIAMMIASSEAREFFVGAWNASLNTPLSFWTRATALVWVHGWWLLWRAFVEDELEEE
jgi:hypothetical protein